MLLQQTCRNGATLTKLPQDLFQLESEMMSPPNPAQVRKYNNIWERHCQIRKGAENKCRKLKMGANPWSPKLQLLRDTINVSN
jgi:hypothetical protein